MPRSQPTLPGIEEAADEAATIRADVDVAPVFTESIDLGPAVEPSVADAPYCYQCGNVMQRAGSCFVCSSCGTTSGCS